MLISSYFKDHSERLAYPEHSDARDGLRRAQRGAVFAIGSHFTLSREAALISMPTGTGKTGVLMMAPFLLKATRALVITPSRMVRDQIVEEFQELALLKRLGVLPSDLPCPTILGIESKILRDEQWDALRAADVVVTTPMGSSPALEGVPHPPQGLFDLLLIDEAHHSPARTWTALIEAFPPSRQILFTATPFRRDRKQLPGRFVYEFPLREAFHDGVFGAIRFIGCDVDPSTPNDVVIARRAEAQYRADRSADLDHRLMVRTDSRTRATELKTLYEQTTTLRLNVVHGNHTLRHIRKTVQQLRDGTLDGVICVDMLGEGVDVPQLKIAAIHAPHRSLAVTLQFIGRFARTSGGNLGEAKFIAIPEEIEAETKELYQQGAVWEQLVTNLADSRIAGERQLREQIRTFSLDSAATDEEVALSVIKPWYHCKVFHVGGPVDLHVPLTFSGDIAIMQQFVSDELHCAVYVCQAVRKPRWIEVPSLQDVEYLLFIVHYDEAHHLLFINSSIKSEDMYSEIAEQIITNSIFRGVSTTHINRALRALQQPKFFSVGLKSRLFGNAVESYRTISGGNADGAVSHTDAQLFDRGHLFGGGESVEGKVTLGISTLSKLWSNRSGFVPEFVSWCDAIAEHLSNSASVITGSRIDLLATGEEVASIPAPVIGAHWHESVYKTRPLARIDSSGSTEQDLLSLDWGITSCTGSTVLLELVGLGHAVSVRFQIDDQQRYRVNSPDGDVFVQFRAHETTLEGYLNSFGLHLYLADFSRLQGNQLFRSNLTLETLPDDAFDRKDWSALGVNITREFGNGSTGKSIHDGLSELLCQSVAPVVVYDHRPGEVGDFVVLHSADGRVSCEVFHCKGSGGASPGSRVGDAYEVVGRGQLLARGLARGMIWSNGELPPESPKFSPHLTVDLLDHGYRLLDAAVSLLEHSGNSTDDTDRSLRLAGEAIESAVRKGQVAESSRGFHLVCAAAAFHLAHYSARSYCLLRGALESLNLSSPEKLLCLLMKRDLAMLQRESLTWVRNPEHSRSTHSTSRSFFATFGHSAR